MHGKLQTPVYHPSVKHLTVLSPEPWTNLLIKDRGGITPAWWTHTHTFSHTHTHTHFQTNTDTGLMSPSCEWLRDTARQQLMWRGGRTCWPTKQREGRGERQREGASERKERWREGGGDEEDVAVELGSGKCNRDVHSCGQVTYYSRKHNRL